MKKLKYYKNLDSLRAFAAIGVIIAHYFDQNRIDESSIFFKICQLGNTGVSLFFVLSGFVITRILINSVNSQTYFSSFYIRRTLRIFPLYYFALMSYYLFPFLTSHSNVLFDFTKEKFYYFVYLQNFARTFNWASSGPQHFWSLAVEEHFYLIWPAIIFFTIKRNESTLLYISIILFIFTHVVRFLMSNNNLEINVFTFSRLDQLILGSLIAIIELKGGISEKFNKYYFYLCMIGILGITILEIQNKHIIKDVFKHTFFGFLYAGLIMFVIANSHSNILNKFLQNLFLQYLGKISYGIYVWHMIAIYIVEYYFNLGIILGFVVTLLATILISFLSFNIVETPFLKLKSKFEYSKL
jgi:peptidoglycan/LPS O-acetylase OafA/YrhL